MIKVNQEDIVFGGLTLTAAEQSIPKDAFQEPMCADPCPWGSNDGSRNEWGGLRSALCARRKGHEGPHWAVGGEVWKPFDEVLEDAKKTKETP